MKGEHARKRQQMGVIYHILERGLPMLEYEASKELLGFLGVPKMPQGHWSDNSGWVIAEFMNLQVLEKQRETVKSAKYFSVTCDEVTTIDNGTWVSVHMYVMKDFERFHMLAALERVEGATSNNLTKVIMASVQAVSGLNREEVSTRMVCFGAG